MRVVHLEKEVVTAKVWVEKKGSIPKKREVGVFHVALGGQQNVEVLFSFVDVIFSLEYDHK